MRVVIAGGGPTGLMVAGELALAGVETVIVERRTSQVLDGSRSGGLHARTVEVLEQRGIAERFITAGQKHPALGYGGTALDVTDTPTRHPYTLALWQSEFERILADWVLGELRVPIRRGYDVVDVEQDDAGVDVELSDGTTLRAAYLVGCDGGRSVVRKAAGIDFPGLEPSTSWMIAEIELDGEPELGFRRDHLGQHAMGRRRPEEPVRVVLTEASVDHDGEPTFDELRAALIGVYGTDFGLRSATWISRFTDRVRQADRYRVGRVLLAGDAAHVHPPQGGQGLNTGVQDAVNLGWKLAQVVRGTSPASLLDSYHAERHPVGARVLRNTMAQVALASPDERHDALRETVVDLLTVEGARKRVVAMITGLDICYGGGEHALVGRRLPDVDLQIGAESTRVSTLLHAARAVLLTLGATGAFDLGPWVDRVRRVDAQPIDAWELPVLGSVDPVPALLLRPDGHVAWVGGLTDPGLPGALDTWFGAGIAAAFGG